MVPQEVAKRDKTSDVNVVNFKAKDELTPIQRRAITLLSMGKTISEVAKTLDKDRKTLYRWLENPHYIAEYNRMQCELSDGVRNRLHSLAGKAVDVIEAKLDEGNLRAAIELLKIISVYGKLPETSTLSDPEIIAKDRAEKVAIAEMKKTSYSNDFTGRLARDIAETLKERYNIEPAIREYLPDN